jgi:membrane-associated phospholipid phosphatase
VRIIFRNNFLLLFPYLLFLIIGAFLIFANTKSETHLEFNRFHNSFFDVFFSYLTYLGDGFSALIAFVILLVVKWRFALLVGFSNILSASITQTLKHTLFSDVVRPKKFFEGIHDIYLVPGVDNHLYNSFPSGHSTCAFALYFSIGMIVENKWLKLLCFFLALFVGYSRIYLSQHFFQDVYAGSLIGVVSTVFIYVIINNSNAEWMDRSLRILKRSV